MRYASLTGQSCIKYSITISRFVNEMNTLKDRKDVSLIGSYENEWLELFNEQDPAKHNLEAK